MSGGGAVNDGGAVSDGGPVRRVYSSVFASAGISNCLS
jgi:hypothetical protein